ncbi:MAG: ABC transporter substrate-binding protein [Candidatus Binatia bacterium]
MKSVLQKVGISCISIFFFLASSLGAASLDPAFLNAQREAEAKDFIFETRHDEIVAKARKEGSLRALIGWDPANYPHLIGAFKKKYPFIDVHLEEIGSDAAQRFVLEMKAGRVRDWDVVHINTDHYSEFPPFLKRFDILGMAEHKVLSVPKGMIDPRQRNLIALGNLVDVVGYNKNLISREQVPNTWHDFLKPELKGKKFLVDIRPLGYAALVPELGLDWAVDYAKKLAAQDPVWVRGFTRAYTAIVAGEYAFHSLGNYNAIMRAARKDPSGSLQFKIIEPVPVRLHEPQGVYRSAANPYAGLLWLEFQAGPEAQKIIDQYEPLKSSIHAPGAEVAKLIRGRKISVKGWDNWEDYTKWVGLLTEAFGFPKAQIK